MFLLFGVTALVVGAPNAQTREIHAHVSDAMILGDLKLFHYVCDHLFNPDPELLQMINKNFIHISTLKHWALCDSMCHLSQT